MSKQRRDAIPKNKDLDATHFGGATVLGEPLHLLFSAMSRFNLIDLADGRVSVTFDLPADEGKALTHAMSRAERPVRGDRRPAREREVDRLLIVVDRVMEAANAAARGRTLASFRADLPHRHRGRLG